MGKGFERLFENMDDLEIDVPGATSIVASFLARALVDGGNYVCLNSFAFRYLCMLT
jgi:hypothetical protein